LKGCRETPECLLLDGALERTRTKVRESLIQTAVRFLLRSCPQVRSPH
jgi:hypothetical protein